MTEGKEVTFSKGSISLKSGAIFYVMMEWERELMKRHAEIVCRNGGHILEIGFGMGISADYIQQQNISSHTIIEVNPQILKKAIIWAKNKPNVKVIEGSWYTLKIELSKKKWDGIWYDADDLNHTKLREALVDKSLNKGGIFSYFAPCGTDVHKYGDKLKSDEVIIEENIPRNLYWNNKVCKVPYITK